MIFADYIGGMLGQATGFSVLGLIVFAFIKPPSLAHSLWMGANFALVSTALVTFPIWGQTATLDLIVLGICSATVGVAAGLASWELRRKRAS